MSTYDGNGTNGGELKAAGLKRKSARRAARTRRSDDETGALLILALMFITVISVIGTSLTLWATNNLNNTTKFATALSLQSASNSITQVAVQDVRYHFEASTLNASPPAACWTPSSGAPVAQAQFNSEWVAVWCSTQWNPLNPATRVVTFSTCLEPSNAQITDPLQVTTVATACAQNPFLQAMVQFDDLPSTVGSFDCSPLGNSTCGTAFTVLSWAFGVTMPSISPSPSTVVQTSPTLLCSSTDEVDIAGAQLAGATSVNFILSSANNVILTAVPSSITPGSLKACAPSQVKSGTSYPVSVTTPSGTSATVSLAF